MSDFAKMFQSEQYGQLVVIMQGADDTGQPELRLFMQPEDFGVCSMALKYDDTDLGWDKCEANFDKLDLTWAERVVKTVFDQLAAMRAQTE